MEIRRKDKILTEIIKAHQKYVDWWLPIDIAGDSFLAPMSCQIFCEYLLVHDDDDDWWYRWMDNDFLTEDAKLYDKRSVLDLLRQHSLKWIDLNNMTSNLEEHKKYMETITELR